MDDQETGQHDFRAGHRVSRQTGRTATVTRRCRRCELWETPYSRERPCLGRPLTVDELRRELADED